MSKTVLVLSISWPRRVRSLSSTCGSATHHLRCRRCGHWKKGRQRSMVPTPVPGSCATSWACGAGIGAVRPDPGPGRHPGRRVARVAGGHAAPGRRRAPRGAWSRWGKKRIDRNVSQGLAFVPCWGSGASDSIPPEAPQVPRLSRWLGLQQPDDAAIRHRVCEHLVSVGSGLDCQRPRCDSGKGG